MFIPAIRHLNRSGRNVLIEHAIMLNRIQQMGKEIQVFLDKNERKTIFVGVLTGAVDFAMKLIDELNPNTFVYNFCKVTRYKESQEGGKAQVVFDGVLDSDIVGASVVIIDDIADQRITLDCIIAHYLKRGAAEVRVCVMLNKFERKSASAEVALDWVGFDIPDVFVWGFGLDDSRDSMTRNDRDVCYWGQTIPSTGFLYTLPNPQTMAK